MLGKLFFKTLGYLVGRLLFRKEQKPLGFSSSIKKTRKRNVSENLVDPYEEITWATPVEILETYERQKGECFFCAASVSKQSTRLDYIIPLTRGGKREPNNLAVSCPTCNRIENKRKRNRGIWRKRIRAGKGSPTKREVRAIYSRQRRQHRSARAAGSFSQADIDRIYRQQNGCCQYCGIRVYDRKDYHVDHVVPLSRGGTNYPANLVIACTKCNISKGDKLLHEWPERPTKMSAPVSGPSMHRKRFLGIF